MKRIPLLCCFLFLFAGLGLSQEHTVARQWNEMILYSIRHDFARPTVHARNLYHASVMMYDAWAAYDEQAETFFLGKSQRGYFCPFDGVAPPEDVQAAREEALSYAVYRLIRHRFEFSPGSEQIMIKADSLIRGLGYDPNVTTTNYQSDGPAALGNYLGERMIEFGLQDGSNEAFDYLNFYYLPINPPLVTDEPGNPNIRDLNRWQPLTLETFIDQAGNPIPFNTPEFLSPEWGWVVPFSLPDTAASFYDRDGGSYVVFHDPGPPPMINMDSITTQSEWYKWGFSMVSIWQAHLDANDPTVWDISPASIGNNPRMPDDFADYPNYYQYEAGGDASRGHAINPATGEPYAPNLVPRADYARVLAEFWADGPDSETPPGHWYVIMNYVHDHPDFERRYRGMGEELDPLEWDVKAYFMLGGAMHDAAIAAWSVKGYYDYIRPISAIRGMAEMGQSSDPELPRYHPAGMPLVDGYIELVTEEDIQQGLFAQEDLNKIKVYTWRGHDYIDDPQVDEAGVGWILAANWWPYQRPSFVTPPFAGYVSGHSTYSRAAAEVLTLLTGDAFFPGGMGEFPVKKDEFLVFEDGPSMDFTLQWATYRDASDQTSLSRIWGGIHPPADDLPGRIIGEKVGVHAFEYAEQFFNLQVTSTEEVVEAAQWLRAFPNPVHHQLYLQAEEGRRVAYTLFNQLGQPVRSAPYMYVSVGRGIDMTGLPAGVYWLKVRDLNTAARQTLKVVKY